MMSLRVEEYETTTTTSTADTLHQAATKVAIPQLDLSQLSSLHPTPSSLCRSGHNGSSSALPLTPGGVMMTPPTSSTQVGRTNVQVSVRVRPPDFPTTPTSSSCCVKTDHQGTLWLTDNVGRERCFSFDHCFDHCDPQTAEQQQLQNVVPVNKNQEEVWERMGPMLLHHALSGFNVCVFAYGQTGSGKTFTMSGTEDAPGFIPRCCKGLVAKVSGCTDKAKSDSNAVTTSVEVILSVYEIYHEQVFCLIDPKRKRVKAREHPALGTYVSGLAEMNVTSFDEISPVLTQALKNRKTAATAGNTHSSRSHCICCLTVNQRKFHSQTAEVYETTTSRVHLVDLAGSEKAQRNSLDSPCESSRGRSAAALGPDADTFREGVTINKSLLALGNVINSLSSGSSRRHINYRDSLLSYVLKDALGGNSQTIMIAAISPHQQHYEETLRTLRYAERAKHIQNRPIVNECGTSKVIKEMKEEMALLQRHLSTILTCPANDLPRLVNTLNKLNTLKIESNPWSGRDSNNSNHNTTNPRSGDSSALRRPIPMRSPGAPHRVVFVPPKEILQDGAPLLQLVHPIVPGAPALIPLPISGVIRLVVGETDVDTDMVTYTIRCPPLPKHLLTPRNVEQGGNSSEEATVAVFSSWPHDSSNGNTTTTNSGVTVNVQHVKGNVVLPNPEENGLKFNCADPCRLTEWVRLGGYTFRYVQVESSAFGDMDDIPQQLMTTCQESLTSPTTYSSRVTRINRSCSLSLNMSGGIVSPPSASIQRTPLTPAMQQQTSTSDVCTDDQYYPTSAFSSARNSSLNKSNINSQQPHALPHFEPPSSRNTTETVESAKHSSRTQPDTDTSTDNGHCVPFKDTISACGETLSDHHLSSLEDSNTTITTELECILQQHSANKLNNTDNISETQSGSSRGQAGGIPIMSSRYPSTSHRDMGRDTPTTLLSDEYITKIDMNASSHSSMVEPTPGSTCAYGHNTNNTNNKTQRNSTSSSGSTGTARWTQSSEETGHLVSARHHATSTTVSTTHRVPTKGPVRTVSPHPTNNIHYVERLIAQITESSLYAALCEELHSTPSVLSPRGTADSDTDIDNEGEPDKAHHNNNNNNKQKMVGISRMNNFRVTQNTNLVNRFNTAQHTLHVLLMQVSQSPANYNYNATTPSHELTVDSISVSDLHGLVHIQAIRIQRELWHIVSTIDAMLKLITKHKRHSQHSNTAASPSSRCHSPGGGQCGVYTLVNVYQGLTTFQQLIPLYLTVSTHCRTVVVHNKSTNKRSTPTLTPTVTTTPTPSPSPVPPQPTARASSKTKKHKKEGARKPGKSRSRSHSREKDTTVPTSTTTTCSSVVSTPKQHQFDIHQVGNNMRTKTTTYVRTNTRKERDEPNCSTPQVVHSSRGRRSRSIPNIDKHRPSSTASSHNGHHSTPRSGPATVFAPKCTKVNTATPLPGGSRDIFQHYSGSALEGLAYSRILYRSSPQKSATTTPTAPLGSGRKRAQSNVVGAASSGHHKHPAGVKTQFGGSSYENASVGGKGCLTFRPMSTTAENKENATVPIKKRSSSKDRLRDNLQFSF